LSGLLERFRGGDRRALARLISQVEGRTPAGQEALKALFPMTGRAHLVGITGPPGAGKSTLVNALIHGYRGAGRTVGVLAIDPSSTLTGGAALGDRIRMMENYADSGVFIRSLATRGQLGGLSLAVSGAAHLLDAFGFDMILIETVGVGQDEVDIADAADTTVVVQVPGLGDSIQTIKAGILEIADILVVNKADRPESRQLVRDLRNMLLLGDHGEEMPRIVSTTASDGTGIPKLIEAIDEHKARLDASGRSRERRERRLLREVELLADEEFDRWLQARLERLGCEPSGEELLSRQVDPGTLAARVVDEFRAAHQRARS
jgi:LAO/AO transport system kinase